MNCELIYIVTYYSPVRNMNVTEYLTHEQTAAQLQYLIEKYGFPVFWKVEYIGKNDPNV